MLTKEQVKKIKWYRQSGPGVPICIGMPFLGITKMKERSGFIFENDLVFFLHDENGSHFYHYFDYYLALKEVEKILKKIDEDIDFFWQMKKEFYEAGSQMEKAGQEILEASNLFDNFQNYYQHFYNQTMNFWKASLFIDLMDPFEKNILEFTFGDQLKDLSKEEINTLTSPTELSNIQREQQELLRLYKSSKDKNIEDGLKDISDKYYWIKNDYAHIDYLGPKYFKEELEKMDKDLKLVEQFEHDGKRFNESVSKQKELIKNKQFDEKTIQKINFFNWITIYRDDRKKYTLISNHFLMELIKKINQEYKIDLKLLENILPNELEQFLKDIQRGDFKKLEERKRFGILTYAAENKMEIISGPEVKEYFKIVEATITASEIHGSTASPGKVIGQVKIVLNQNDFPKLQKGDILVASMTRPDYAPILRKAAAIVTDEGGITCHAAIVSRELGIPCIVGTQVATRALKDGDLIDVNANHGLIKIIHPVKSK